ncbi:hypothetical protein RN001_010121 [Aquatica leii]|uniref:Ubiquitin carboxyl-terminal hydrolase n=1 Tax=Aquatica leii TaxID=1421715 RepID=A0AAN7P0G5_9COLE|nr:hypothetical protein RN001_010121 [Aquatica leii]
MPASTLDPVNAALRTALSKNAFNNNNLDSQLAGSTKKALLSNIEFEAAGSYQSCVLDKLKSKYIVLKSSEPTEGSKNQNKSENMVTADDGLTAAKRELYPLKSVQLGWNNADWSVGAGMVNMGNTCYLNSTLQALFHVPALVNWLISEKQHISECEDSGGSMCIICAVRKTLQDSQQRNTNSIRPYLIFNKLRIVCRNLIPGRQEDAHEFLRYLVEAMEKAYLNRFKNNAEFDSRTKETTPLNQILGGYLRSAVRCLECGNVSTTFQHFQDVLLDIRKAQTLDEALELYFSREKLDDDSYHCESCQKKVPAWKQFSLERAPMVLCIQLKRFSISNNKITKQVQFKQRLDLTRFMRRKPVGSLIYRLVALVTHMGPSVNCGHYTAIAQGPSGNFYQFDDSVVKPISHQAVFSTNAYIMFYELENSPFTQKNGKIPSTISTITQLQAEESSSTPLNGNVKVYGPALPPNKFQKPIGLGQNGVTLSVNGSLAQAEKKLADNYIEKTTQKENKPLPINSPVKPPTNENKAPLTTQADSNCSKLAISSPNVSSTTSEQSKSQSKEQPTSTQITKLVPYDMDDSSSSNSEELNGASSTANSQKKFANLGDWKVSSSSDVVPEPSSEGSTWESKSNPVNELFQMSHNGYGHPVSTWNGTRSLLDKEVNNDRREERKRTMADNPEPCRIKHPKLVSSISHNGNYNPVQEYHNSKNWVASKGPHHYRTGYNVTKRHRNEHRSYHHKNYYKNHRFRH